MASLVLPLLLELSLGLLVGMVGTIWAARVSDASGGSCALANHVFGFLFMVFRLVGAGISVVISQNLGAGDRREADLIARAALAWGTWMGGAGRPLRRLRCCCIGEAAQCARRCGVVGCASIASSSAWITLGCVECLYGQCHASPFA